ncbi:MAG TPA: CsgG/HfaB family protein [Methylomirabilota bacterium]|nr:CsgG/HfaB family protein [Methylomirabilota bacterium]
MGGRRDVGVVSVLGVLLVGLAGVASAQLIKPKATVTSPEGKSIEEAQQEAYDGPKARVAVAQFKDKTGKGWWTGQIGDGMADMLATALFHSNRYIVLERQTLGDVLKEQDLGTAGRIKKGTEAAVGEIEGAELLITGAVTEFEGNQSGVGGGIGGIGGTAGRILGGIAGGIKKAHMAIDVRVIDTKTSRIVSATSVEGEATDFALGGALAGAGGGGALGGALGGWSKTPTEKALRICIQEAVKFIVTKTPATYYRHRPGGATVAAAAAPAPAPTAALAPAATVAPATAGTAMAAAPPADAAGTPSALSVLKSIRTDLDKQVVADLNEVKLRGAVLSVIVSLRAVGKKTSEHLHLSNNGSLILNYDTGETAPLINADGMTSGRLQPGETKTLRATFKAPKGAKKVGITLSGIGTFDDVEVAK